MEFLFYLMGAVMMVALLALASSSRKRADTIVAAEKRAVETARETAERNLAEEENAKRHGFVQYLIAQRSKLFDHISQIENVLEAKKPDAWRQDDEEDPAALDTAFRTDGQKIDELSALSARREAAIGQYREIEARIVELTG